MMLDSFLTNLSVDRGPTGLRRCEPNSRTTLCIEQMHPWDLLQPQEVMSRHRGAERGLK